MIPTHPLRSPTYCRAPDIFLDNGLNFDLQNLSHFFESLSTTTALPLAIVCDSLMEMATVLPSQQVLQG